MSEYVDRDVVTQMINEWADRYSYIEVPTDWAEDEVRKLPAADVVEVKLLEDGTLVVTTDKYPNVTRVFVEDGKTSGSLFYADEV